MKRLLVIAAALSLSLVWISGATAISAEQGAPAPVVLELRDGALLVGPDGQALTDRGAYESIERVTGSGAKAVFAAYKKGAGAPTCALLGPEGAPLNDVLYEAAYGEGGVIYVIRDGLTGALDTELRELVPCAYTQLVKSGENTFLALNTDPYDERADGVYLVENGGAERATGIRVSFGLAVFADGMMPVVGDNGRMGYLNERGEWAITAQYDYAGEFKGGVAEAVLTTGAGLIDKKGNWLITPKYEGIEIGGGEGRLILAQEDSTQILLLNPDDYSVMKRFTGEEIYVSAYFDQDLAVLYLDDCTQLIDGDGDVVMEAGLDAGFDVYSVMGERLIVRRGAWGEKCLYLCARDGGEIAGPYRELMCLGDAGGRVLFLASDYDVREEVDVEAAFTNAFEIEGTRVTSVIDQDANVVFGARAYREVTLDASGLLTYTSEDQSGVLDLTGREIAAFDLIGATVK